MSVREYARWNPSRWSGVKVRRYRRHVFDRASQELLCLMGETAVHLFAVWFNATVGSAVSRDELHARGVKLIGDTDGNTSTTPRE